MGGVGMVRQSSGWISAEWRDTERKDWLYSPVQTQDLEKKRNAFSSWCRCYRTLHQPQRNPQCGLSVPLEVRKEGLMSAEDVTGSTGLRVLSSKMHLTNVTRCDMMWRDTMWCDMMSCHVIWHDMIWYDMIWYGTIWNDMTWHDMIWYDMTWYDMIWHDVMWFSSSPRSSLPRLCSVDFMSVISSCFLPAPSGRGI
jgi:hypothetical protein